MRTGDTIKWVRERRRSRKRSARRQAEYTRQATHMRGLTLFSGGGLVEAMLKDKVNWIGAVEWDSKIADVYRRNHGNHIVTASVTEVDAAQFGRVDYLHASPVCKEYSNAKTAGAEGELDIATAQATARFIRDLRPHYFTLENVRAYARGYWHDSTLEERANRPQALGIILDALRECGYFVSMAIVNAADYGVPQTRIRLYVRAALDRMPAALAPTHRNGGDMFSPSWQGWYSAIEDLIPSLPDDDFAPWQWERIPDDVRQSFVLSNNKQEYSDGLRYYHEPAHAITTQTYGRTRAFIVDGIANSNGESVTIRNVNDGSFTLRAQQYKAMPRAFVVSGGNERAPVRYDTEPIYTIASSGAGTGLSNRAWLPAGHIVRITPRCLARFQTLPDWYELPASNALACTIIGNGVPSKLAREMALSFIPV